MRSAPFLLAAFACLAAHDASAGGHHGDCCLTLSSDDWVRCGERYKAGDIRFSIPTESRDVILLITDDVVALQFSDRFLKKLDRKVKDAEDEGEDRGLGYVIKTAVLASVRSAFDHSAECDISDIDSVDYRDGELVLRARNGKRIFNHVEVDDEDVMSDFSDADARAFVRQLRRRMEM